MADLDDPGALGFGTQAIFKDLLNGPIKIALQKQRLVTEANSGHALDISALAQLRDQRRREGIENSPVPSQIESLDFSFDDGAQAIGSRHHNEHLIIPIPCNPAPPE